ncbi:MAG: hypothetical protein LBU89_08390 [Fibromonadaceae bacterium]|nr:hypothetical protein [Fibromonadaceae bacterium]
MAGLAKLVNRGTSFEGKTIILIQSIVLNNITNLENWKNSPPKNTWVPIGDNANAFKGKFLGGGHAISGVFIDNSDDYQGLFGHIGASGIVSNFWLIAYVNGGVNVGSLVGLNKGDILSVFSAGVVTGESNVGGIAGYNNNKIFKSNCIGLLRGERNLGGVAGNNKGHILNSFCCCNFKAGNMHNLASSDINKHVGLFNRKLAALLNKLRKLTDKLLVRITLTKMATRAKALRQTKVHKRKALACD